MDNGEHKNRSIIQKSFSEFVENCITAIMTYFNVVFAFFTTQLGNNNVQGESFGFTYIDEARDVGCTNKIGVNNLNIPRGAASRGNVGNRRIERRGQSYNTTTTIGGNNVFESHNVAYNRFIIIVIIAIIGFIVIYKM